MEKVFSATESANFVELFNIYAEGDQKREFSEFIKIWCYNKVTHLEDMEDAEAMKAIIKKAMDAEFVYDMLQGPSCK